MATKDLIGEQLRVEEHQATEEERHDSVPDYFIEILKHTLTHDFNEEQEIQSEVASNQKVFNTIAKDDPPSSIFSKFTWGDFWGIVGVSLASVLVLAVFSHFSGVSQQPVSFQEEIDRTLVAIEQLNINGQEDEDEWGDLADELDTIQY